MRFRLNSLARLLPGLLLVSGAAEALDPWNVDKALPARPASALVATEQECQPGGVLDLEAVVRVALCRNPATRISWLQAMAQAQRVGVAKADYLPTLDLSASQSKAFGDNAGQSTNTTSANLSLNWLLYDFGAREANVRSSQRTLEALQASHDDSLQTVFKSAVDAYYQWFAADAALTAAKEAEAAAAETLRAAEARQQVGSATREDTLQAQTALSQAKLVTIQRDGAREIALGNVALVLGLPANSNVQLTAPGQARPQSVAPPDWQALLDHAKQQRPDLRAQSLRVQVAEASRDQTRDSGLPSISAFAREGYNKNDVSDGTGGSVGLSVQVPIFSGFRTSYQTRAAEQQIEIEKASYERLSQQASLDIWQAWQNLRTATVTVSASDDVVASAQESLRAALARYKAGLGNLINVLNAQSTLASARQQQATARYDWHRARIALARASGDLGFAALAEPATGNTP